MSSQPPTFWQRIGSALPSFGFGYASALSGNNAFSHNNAQAGLINAGSLINARGFGIDQQVAVHDLLGIAEIACEHRPEVQQTFQQAQGLISTVDDEIAHGMRVVDVRSAEALAIADRRSGEALAIADRRSGELIGESKAYRKILTELTSMDFMPTAKVTSIMGALYLELQYKLIGKLSETVTELVSENPVASFTLMALGAGAWLCHKYRQALAVDTAPPIESDSDLAEPVLNADTVYQHLSEAQKVELLNLVMPLTRYVELLQAHDVRINFELIRLLACQSAGALEEIFAEMIAKDCLTYWRLLFRLRFNEFFSDDSEVYSFHDAVNEELSRLFYEHNSSGVVSTLYCLYINNITLSTAEATAFINHAHPQLRASLHFLNRLLNSFQGWPQSEKTAFFKVLLKHPAPWHAYHGFKAFADIYGPFIADRQMVYVELLQLDDPWHEVQWYKMRKGNAFTEIPAHQLISLLKMDSTQRELAYQNFIEQNCYSSSDEDEVSDDDIEPTLRVEVRA